GGGFLTTPGGTIGVVTFRRALHIWSAYNGDQRTTLDPVGGPTFIGEKRMRRAWNADYLQRRWQWIEAFGARKVVTGHGSYSLGPRRMTYRQLLALPDSPQQMLTA